jgi:murein DD-endopeptidase MepM/ murein hydrolase activator NlpD
MAITHRLVELLSDQVSSPISILGDIPLGKYVPLDLSTQNRALEGKDISDPDTCWAYIDSVLEDKGAQVAFGGYLEQRELYTKNAHFGTLEEVRDVHLGVDFWARAGTAVFVPFEGKVHSFGNNTSLGDYGPTIVLEHTIGKQVFHTLYGHLSLESLNGLQPGKWFPRGSILATLGTSDINVNYAPHLHFQLIVDMEGKEGDYPGVCALKSLEYYSKNCPHPNLLLKM